MFWGVTSSVCSPVQSHIELALQAFISHCITFPQVKATVHGNPHLCVGLQQRHPRLFERRYILWAGKNMAYTIYWLQRNSFASLSAELLHSYCLRAQVDDRWIDWWKDWCKEIYGTFWKMYRRLMERLTERSMERLMDRSIEGWIEVQMLSSPQRCCYRSYQGPRLWSDTPSNLFPTALFPGGAVPDPIQSVRVWVPIHV
jgi:hypothetical protein